MKYTHCLGGVCGGSLVSPRVVITAYHCAVAAQGTSVSACDHSDGKRLALLGRHSIYQLDHIIVPIIKALYPPIPWLQEDDYTSHDLLLYLLASPVKYNNKVSPICLPEPHAEFGGMKATATGWGRTDKPSISKTQSPVLKAVELTVSNRKYKNKKVLGTELEVKQKLYQDPCSGDSGNVTCF